MMPNPITITDVEGGTWRTVYTVMNLDEVRAQLRPGFKLPVRKGCCIHYTPFHAIQFPNGAEWDEMNGWRTKYKW